ncbi:bestrophin family protein [Pontimicrobium sp. IMCC45349]|uniref:bestrophin family protein n=1 Tax=Pontimicrobium sp. IMCC45349 TaxID=3391574 RepID=UPI00399FE1B4
MILDKRIPFSYWFSKIKWDILIVTLFSIITYLVSEYAFEINIPSSIGAFLGTAIALLLSFKLSQSYDRWWEARKIWGAIVNDSRTLTIQVKQFCIKKDHELINTIANRQIAWCYSLGQNLRQQNALDNISLYINDNEYNSLKKHSNVPLALLDHHSKNTKTLLDTKHLSKFEHMQIDNTIVRLCASMGKAERIKNTAFPKTYRLTLHLFIYVFLAALFFSLNNLPYLLEVPLLIFIAIPFFLLEKIAFTIQDPFENRPTDTAMTSIARTIEINIKQLLEHDDIPQPLSPEKYYML